MEYVSETSVGLKGKYHPGKLELNGKLILK
jgi:hypothetical protein